MGAWAPGTWASGAWAPGTWDGLGVPVPAGNLAWAQLAWAPGAWAADSWDGMGGVSTLVGGTVAATLNTSTGVVISSLLPASGGTAPITYQWRRKSGVGAYFNISGATSETLIDLTLSPSVSYTFKRVATDSLGNSADSNEVAIDTTPAIIADIGRRIDSRAVASKTHILNLALGRIGVSKQVANIETERSREAIAGRLCFDDERDYVLRDFPWPFATGYATLGLIQEEPNNDWLYAYRYPVDAAYIRRIVTALGRIDTHPPPFKVGRDANGPVVYTDEPDAVVEYTLAVVPPESFDPLFISALAWKLASVLAPSFSKIKDMARQAIAMYERDKLKAEAAALNEGQAEEQPDAEWIAAR